VIDWKAIRKIDSHGNVSTVAGAVMEFGKNDGQGTAARFWSLHALAIDKAGNLYAADGDLKNIRRITPTGRVQTLRGPDHANLPVNHPMGLACDAENRLYIADQNNNTIILVEFPAAGH
jgi:hypothetical protein